MITDELQAPSLTRDDSGYDAARTGFQTYRPHEPDIIVTAHTAADVQAAVRYARRHDLPVAVQASGHGLATAAERGVLIDTSTMTDFRIEPATRTLTASAGVRWKSVIATAAEHGLAPLSGSAPDVGVVGYTLGGGFGILSREFGYAADLVRSVDVVTADGDLRHVDDDTDPDLFWALRGGRDNFGIVTSIEMDLLPIARLYGGGLYFDTHLVPQVLEAYRGWTADVPEELSSAVGLIPVPDIPAMPGQIRGKYVAHVRIGFTGTAEKGDRLVRPLREIGLPLLATLGEMPYADCGSIYSDPPFPHAYTGNNVMLSSLDAADVDRLLEHVGPDAAVPCVAEVRHLGGAMARKPSIANAVGHRDAEFVVRAISMIPDDFDIDDVRAVHRSLVASLSPHKVGRSVSFVYRGDPVLDPIDDAFDVDDYRRLVDLKAQHDPSNMFRLNQNVR